MVNNALLRTSGVFLFVFSVAPALDAYTSLGALRWGDELRGNSARSLAMGATGIASGDEPASFFANPAILSRLKNANAVSISPGFSNVFYRRTHADNTFVADSQTLFHLQSFAASARHPSAAPTRAITGPPQRARVMRRRSHAARGRAYRSVPASVRHP